MNSLALRSLFKETVSNKMHAYVWHEKNIIEKKARNNCLLTYNIS